MCKSIVVHCGDKPARRCQRDGVERLPGGLFAGIVCCARVAPLGDRERQVWCEPGGPNLGVQIRTSVVSFERVHGGLHAPKKTNYMELSEGALIRKALPAVASKKRAKRCRDGLAVQGHCMFANDPDTIIRLEVTLSLAQSLTEVSAHKKTKEDESKVEKAKEAWPPC